MKFKITKASDYNFKEYKEINSLEELIALKKEAEYGLALYDNFDKTADFELEIYDGHMKENERYNEYMHCSNCGYKIKLYDDWEFEDTLIGECKNCKSRYFTGKTKNEEK